MIGKKTYMLFLVCQSFLPPLNYANFSFTLLFTQFGNIWNSATGCGKLGYLGNSAANLFGNSVVSQQILQSGSLTKERGPDKSFTLNFGPGRTF